MPTDSSQEKTDLGPGASALELTAADGDTAQEMSDTHEGERLRRLLDSTRYEKKQLADAIGVTKQSVQQWVKQSKFSPAIWEKLQTGLMALGLDPAAIRPTGAVVSSVTIEDLTRLVESWSSVQLSVLKRILESDETSRRVLLAYVYGALRKGE